MYYKLVETELSKHYFKHILFQKNRDYEEIGERDVIDSDPLVGDRGSADQQTFAHLQRRSPSMGYDSAGINAPESLQSRRNSNKQDLQLVGL